MREWRKNSEKYSKKLSILIWRSSLRTMKNCWRKLCVPSMRVRRRILSAPCGSTGKCSRRGRRKDRRRRTAAQAAVSVQAAASAAETTAAALAETRQVPAVRSRAAGNAGKRNCPRRATASWDAAFRAVRPRSCERSHRRWGSLSWKVCCSARRSVSSRAAIISFPC